MAGGWVDKRVGVPRTTVLVSLGLASAAWEGHPGGALAEEERR